MVYVSHVHHSYYLKEGEKLITNNNYFDIETTGLAANDEIICFSYGGLSRVQSRQSSEKDLLLELSRIVCDNPDNQHIVTFFGEPKYGATQGFDMPMVRTRYILNDIADQYPFKGMIHTDVLEVVKKCFNTKTLQEPKAELLSASQVVDLVNLCAMYPLKTKEANLRQIEKAMADSVVGNADGSTTTVYKIVDEFVKANATLKVVENNSLDHVFRLFFPYAEEHILNEEFDGEDMPRLFKEYNESGNEEYLHAIVNHNNNCTYKLMLVYNVCVGSGMVNSLQIPQTRL